MTVVGVGIVTTRDQDQTFPLDNVDTTSLSRERLVSEEPLPTNVQISRQSKPFSVLWRKTPKFLQTRSSGDDNSSVTSGSTMSTGDSSAIGGGAHRGSRHSRSDGVDRDRDRPREQNFTGTTWHTLYDLRANKLLIKTLRPLPQVVLLIARNERCASGAPSL